MEHINFYILIIGSFIGFLIALLYKKNIGANSSGMQEENQLLRDEKVSLQKDVEHLEKRIAHSIEEFTKQKEYERELQKENAQLNSQLSVSDANFKNLSEKLETQKEELENLQDRFTKEFHMVATKILRQNSEEFSKTHKNQLNEILTPLKTKIKNFEDSVEKKYMDETKERSTLKQEIKQLMALNQTLSSDAQNLTRALKGDNKKQGNWGEVILEKILESSGLEKGIEYDTQYSDVNIDNKRIQPDIIINLPDNKHIIVDSKVSLISYEKFCSCEDDEEKNIHLKGHIASVRTHVKGLSEKNYQTGINVNSPDFVLLFIPIESSFSLAIQEDQQLYSYAWDMKVVIVSPTTLLATLRTIASVWKHEKQTKNAIEIADQAGKMYDKFKNFVDDMQKIERGLEMSKSAYKEAFKKLKGGTGNLISRAEKLKKLGIKTNKSIPKNIMETFEKIEDNKEDEKEKINNNETAQ